MRPRKPAQQRRLAGVLSHEDARRRARKVLPRLLFDYVDGGADDELTMRLNGERFQQLWLRPRMGE
jgi:isopentenyl diphosphate isomerase/L-lactate dehydrogenase-like FMN-dependent dehydrogenase